MNRMSKDTIYRQDAIEAIHREARLAGGSAAIEYADMFQETLLGLTPAQPEPFDDGYSGIYIKEENVLKFYYVESEDDYWIGRRLDNFYYATWDRDLQNFVWSKSRHLPWGEHIVAPDTLWKEHTYPSEPKEIPLKDWLKGFYAKYFMPAEQPERNGWVHIDDIYRLISDHNNYHGDNILASLTCLAEGKNVPNPINVLEQPEPHWIPVNERLPDKPNVYTVTDTNGNVVRFAYYGTKSSREYWQRCAVAWMPLPEPWRGDA